MTPTDKKAPPAVSNAADPDAPILSAEDIERIRAKARAQVAADRKKQAEAQLLAEELEKIRGKQGQLTGDPRLDELVNVMIDCGENTDRIVINGRPFFHGRQYMVPRHVADTLREIMWRTQLHEHSITDKPLSSFYQRARNTEVSNRGVINAPRTPDQRVI
jgi:hypothetical protein